MGGLLPKCLVAILFFSSRYVHCQKLYGMHTKGRRLKPPMHMARSYIEYLCQFDCSLCMLFLAFVGIDFCFLTNIDFFERLSGFLTATALPVLAFLGVRSARQT